MLGMSSTQNTGFEKVVRVLLTITMLLVLMIPALCYADEAKEFSGSELNDNGLFSNTEAMVGGSTYTPSLVGYDKYTQIGLDLLYGVDAKQTVYYGEVPRYADKKMAKEAGDESKGIFENKRIFGRSDITGSGYRSYAWDWPGGGQGIFRYIDSYKGSPSDSSKFKDMHLYGLTKGDMWAGNFLRALGNLIPLVIGAIYAINSAILGFMIWVCNFDPGTLANSFGFGSLQQSITKLVIGDSGTPSPLLIIAAAIFIIGLVVLIAKRAISGDAPIRAILTEFMFLILAAILCGVCVSGNLTGLQTTIQKLGETFVSAVAKGSSGSTANTNDPMWLYGYESDNANEDLIKSQTALSKKPYVDLIIYSQFGYEVDELELTDSKWGNVSVDGIASSLSTGNFDLSVSNTTSSGKVMNLGYFWYCADSGVNPNEPLSSSGGKLKTNMGSPDNTLYVIDFLAAVDASTSDSNAHTKAQSIVQHFNDPGIDIGRLFLITVIQLVTAMTAGIIAIFTVIAKLIFFLGLAVLPVFPILLLIPATRSKCRDLLMVWLVSSVKMITGMLILTLVLEFSAILCSQGMVGTLVDLVFMIGMFMLIPKIFMQLNNVFAQYDSKFAATRWANNATGSLFNRVDANRGGRINRIYDQLKQDREKVAEGHSVEEDTLETKKNIEDQFSNVEMQATTGFLNGEAAGGGGGANDDYLSDDAQYQKEKAEFELKYTEDAEQHKIDILDKQQEMEDKFENMREEDQVNEIYNYQRLSKLTELGKTNSKEYQDIVKAQVAIDRGIKEKEVTAEDIKNFKMDNDKVRFYNDMETMTKEDRKDALKAIKSKYNVKGTLKTNVDNNVSDLKETVESKPGGKIAVKIAGATTRGAKAVVKGSAVVNAASQMKDGIKNATPLGKISEKDREVMEHGNEVLSKFTSNKARTARADKATERYKHQMSKTQEEYRRNVSESKVRAIDRQLKVEAPTDSSSSGPDNT